MEQPRVVGLESSQVSEPETVGPKAHSLLRLMRAGMRVPEGFCITVQAFREHFRRTGLDHWIQSRLEFPKAAETPAEIRQAILKSEIDEELANQVYRDYQRLGNGPVAVRSSAAAEDLPGHSFAGQYETVLNISDFPSCLQAVKICWASLWTDRAFSYRQKNGIGHQDIAMAVIIQRQAAADVAGVMFTADPIRGQTDRIVIEACRGLGEALVSGRVTPDEMIFDKKNLKAIWILPADLNGPTCLDVRTGWRLAKAGRKIERVFGGPQDIEWAVVERTIYFLQARPVTTRPIEQTWEDRQIWTNTNTGEVAPDVVTPLDWSILSGVMVKLFENFAWILGIEAGSHPLMGRVAGRVYFNFNIGLAFITKLPSFLIKPKEADALFGGGKKNQYDLRKIRFGPDDLPDLKTGVWKILWRAPYSLVLLYSRRHVRALKILEQVKQYTQHYKSISVESMSAIQIVELLTEIFEQVFVKLDILYLVSGMTSMPLVFSLCRKWLQDENQVIANSLLKAGGDMDDASAGVALSELGQLANQDLQIREALESSNHWKEVKRQLEQTDAGKGFVRVWDQFMGRHGHHCRSEILMFNTRWAEMPDYVLMMVKGCLEKPDHETPARRYGRQVQIQETEIERILEPLKNPFKRWILKRLLRRTHRALAFRENMKSQIVRLLFTVRRIVLALGQKMRANGLLAEAEDIFFLEFEELEAVIDKRADCDIAAMIHRRRQEYERFKAIDPPQVIVGRFDPGSFVPPAVDTEVRWFEGMSACPGKVTGKARVILRADDTQQVIPGEILVAPFTDPGWTPYFVNAAGIVMDQGGLLSHGSIVAREFGIPAVVNVGPATKVIRTGQTLFLDADQGKVTILDPL